MQKLDSIIITGISIQTTNENNKAQIDIPKLWNTFLEENIFSKIIDKINDNIYVVYTDYEGDFTKPYRVIIGCAVSNTNSDGTRKLKYNI